LAWGAVFYSKAADARAAITVLRLNGTRIRGAGMESKIEAVIGTANRQINDAIIAIEIAN
jgi:hypothetical protein